MDYAMPPRRRLSPYEHCISEVPSPIPIRLGVRSGGEGRTTPALAVRDQRDVDALSHLGYATSSMPATPERVWRAYPGGGRKGS